MTTIRSIIYTGGLLLIVAACSSAPEVTKVPTEPPADTSTLEEPTPIPPTLIPVPEKPEESHDPNAILTVDHESDLIRLTALDGKVLDEWGFPGLCFGLRPKNKFHFGGRTADGLINAPCLYVSGLYEEPQIVYHQDKALVPLQEISQLINLVGAPGHPYVAFTFLDAQNLQEFQARRYQAPSDSADEPTTEPVNLHSWLYAGSPETLAEAQPIISRADENGLALYPLAVTMEEDEMMGVWYTLQYKGIAGGGPVFFTGFSRLYFSDLRTGLIDEVLGKGYNTLALSRDQTTAAYEDTGMNDQAIITIYNFVNGKIKFIDVLPDTSPTGVGDAYFSPSGNYLAWREVSIGEEDIFSVIRIASTTGDDLIEIDTREVKTHITSQEIDTITFAGWLDDSTLLIEAHHDGVDLYRISIDGGELEYLVSGYFLGFTYP